MPDFPQSEPAPESTPGSPSAPPPLELPALAPNPGASSRHPYRIGTLDFFADGFRVLVRNPAAVFGAGVVFVLILAGLLVVSLVPHAAWITVPTLFLISGPILGSLGNSALRAWRGEPVRFRDAFTSLRRRPLALILNQFALSLRIVVALIPGSLLVLAGVKWGDSAQTLTPGVVAVILVGLGIAVGSGVLASALWGFSPLLIIDRSLSIREALRTSRRAALARPFRNATLLFSCGIVVFVGFLTAGIGALVTLPWAVSAHARAADEIFGHRHAPSG